MYLSFPKTEYYQWDTGQTAKITTPGLDITEVHMWNDAIGGPTMVQPVHTGDNGRYVEIPDELFQKSGWITCWAVTSDVDGSSTMVDFDRVFVNRRPKPTDYAPGKVETLYYKVLLEELELLTETCAKALQEDLPELKKQISELVETANALKVALDRGELNGKSAYDYAVEGGFTGTEEEFAAALAKAVEEVKYTIEVEVS